MPHAYPSHVRACFVSTYPPRQRGIATFTADLCQALGQGQDNSPPGVMALTNTANEYQYPPEVVFEIRQNQLRDYRLATEYINLSSVDIICLQHEFGIFGGQEGKYSVNPFQQGRQALLRHHCGARDQVMRSCKT